MGDKDILITEKNTDRVVRALDGQILEKPLLDVPVASNIEQGLLGIAVSKHIDGKIFVFLSYPESDYDSDVSDTSIGINLLGNRPYRYEYSNSHLINRSY